ncbi:protease complex subunit PrcB family protein [Candidatus Woesearchaeota archaeon]|jgi:hypothetical protein|nr:protease complex subunit PrcB family protein [Candidatus Woesearchaeota archaeon]
MKKILTILLLISILLISSCSDQKLTFETIHIKNSKGHEEKENYVIKNSLEWNNLLDVVSPLRLYINPDLPDINFEEEMVIAVFQGSQPSSGYSIEITKIIEKDNSIEIIVKEKSAPKNQLVLTMVTEPYHIVKVKKSDKEVVFKS